MDPEFLISQVCATSSIGSKRLCAELIVNDQPIASNNLIGKKWIADTQITPSSSTLVMWYGSRMQPYGESVLKFINHKNKIKYRVKFIVVDKDVTPLLGLGACTQMELLTVNQDEFKRVNSVNAMSN